MDVVNGKIKGINKVDKITPGSAAKKDSDEMNCGFNNNWRLGAICNLTLRYDKGWAGEF